MTTLGGESEVLGPTAWRRENAAFAARKRVAFAALYMAAYRRHALRLVLCSADLLRNIHV